MTARRMPLFEQESCGEIDSLLLLLMRLRIEFIMVRPAIARHIRKANTELVVVRMIMRGWVVQGRTGEDKKKGYTCE